MAYFSAQKYLKYYIQIQHLLKLNAVKLRTNPDFSAIQIQHLLKLN